VHACSWRRQQPSLRLSTACNVIPLNLTPANIDVSSIPSARKPSPYKPLVPPGSCPEASTPLISTSLRPSCVFCRLPPVLLRLLLRLLYTAHYPRQACERTAAPFNLQLSIVAHSSLSLHGTPRPPNRFPSVVNEKVNLDPLQFTLDPKDLGFCKVYRCSDS
jgi:hypothetical protein